MKSIVNKITGKYDLIQLCQELDWANVYHDSIRGREWLIDLPLNVGRMAGNYTFFYLLNRILYDLKPKNILEFGLGESSKFISAYLNNYLLDTTHLIIEDNEIWHHNFINSNTLSVRSQVKIMNVKEQIINECNTYSYVGIDDLDITEYDMFIVDGPLGSEHFSRYDIVNIVKRFDDDKKFIIIMDDCQRLGELQTFEDISHALKERDIPFHSEIYYGLKNVGVIGSKEFPFVATF